MIVKHFCIEILSIRILKIYKYWSSLWVCFNDESVKNLLSSHLSFSTPMNKTTFRNSFFLLFWIFCSIPSFVRIIPITKIIILKTPLAHVYNYFWWTVTLLLLVWKQEINLPIYWPYKVNLFPSKLLSVKKRWTSHGNSTYLR